MWANKHDGTIEHATRRLKQALLTDSTRAKEENFSQ